MDLFSTSFCSCTLLHMLLLMVLSGVFSSADICSPKVDPPPDPCPMNISDPPVISSLPCTHRKSDNENAIYLYRLLPTKPRPNSQNVLKSFHVSQCTTDLSDTNFLGLQFHWTITADDLRRDIKLLITVEHKDLPNEIVGLEVNLTNPVAALQKGNFSTGCVPLSIVSFRRVLHVEAQVLKPASEVFKQSLTINHDCNYPEPSLRHVCPGQPMERPEPHVSCDDGTPTITIKYDTSPPPGAGSTYKVEVGLISTESGSTIYKRITLNSTVPLKKKERKKPTADFVDVPAGTYAASFAFLDNSGDPCGFFHYISEGNVTIEENECETVATTPPPPPPPPPPQPMDLDETRWVLFAIAGVALMTTMILLVLVTIFVTHFKRRCDQSQPCGLPSEADTSWRERVHILHILRGGTTAPSDFRIGVRSEASGQGTRIPGELCSTLDPADYMIDTGCIAYDHQPMSGDSGCVPGWDVQSYKTEIFEN